MSNTQFTAVLLKLKTKYKDSFRKQCWSGFTIRLLATEILGFSRVGQPEGGGASG